MSISLNDIAVILSAAGSAIFALTAIFTISDMNKRHQAEKKNDDAKRTEKNHPPIAEHHLE